MRIELIGEPQIGFLAVKIRNWGLGISEDQFDTIFEPWVRGELPDRVTPTRGMGLGLFLARRIVNAHRGRILVTSTPQAKEPRRSGQAQHAETTFEIRLPRDLPPGAHDYRW